ncbi:MAG: RHS repeat protein [Nonomuraea sp.]|nr:RHS repeat protein [Nonomuraea sp.]
MLGDALDKYRQGRAEPGGRVPLRPAVRAEGTRAGAAASRAWRRGRQFFHNDLVHLPTGVVLLAQTDVDLPGVLPLRLERTHLSTYRTGGWFGRSWASTLDQRLEFDDEGVCLAAADGTLLAFPHPVPGRSVPPDDGTRLALAMAGDGMYTVTDPYTGLITYFAQGTGLMAAVTDRNGNRIDVRHTADGLLTEIAHSGGYHLDVETHQRRVVQIRLREAGQTLLSYGYDRRGDLTEVIDSSGLPLRLAYDEHGRLTSWQDRIGAWYACAYDPEGRCVQGTGAGGARAVEFAYEPGLTRARDSLGHTTSCHHDDLLRVVAETDSLGHTTRYRWDRFDRLLARTDPLGRTTRYAYDAVNLLAVTRPDGAIRRLTHDDLNLPVAVTDFDGTHRTFAYDRRGNLIADGTHTYSYDERGHLTAVTDALGHTRRIRTNPAGLAVAVTDPMGATTRYARDAFGRVTAVVDPLGHTTRFTWTVEGRPASRTLPGGAGERWAYDAEGNLVEHLDPLGRPTRVEVGPFGVVTAQTLPDGARLRFAHDTELRVSAVTDPHGLTWRYRYDPAGNLASETDFDGRVLTYAHDPAGRLAERVNGAGQRSTFHYDVLGRLTERRAAGRVTTYAYDLLGRLVHAANPDAELRLVRDREGRVVAETCGGRTVTSTYDALGRRTGRRTPSGVESVWRFDPCDRPLSLGTAGATIHFAHDPAGRETARRIGPGLVLALEWDRDSRLRAQSLLTGARARLAQGRTYDYRQDGHVTGVHDLLGGRCRYELDAVGRVTAAHGVDRSETYVYDTAGHIVDAAWAGPPGVQGPRGRTGTAVRFAGRGRYEYDRHGRVILHQRQDPSSSRTWRYTWDADDHLTGVVTPDGTRWRYLYDPLDRRIAKEREDGTERVDFVWDGSTLAEERRDGRTTVWEWEPDGLRPVSQLVRAGRGERFYAIVTDLVGAPAELVDTAGNLVWRARRSLWGAPVGPATTGVDCPLRFPGQYADEETGLHYNRFRYYDPGIAQYLSSDPLGLAGGRWPHGYVLNPLTWLDPLGLTACPLPCPPPCPPLGLPPCPPLAGLPSGTHSLAYFAERGGKFGLRPSDDERAPFPARIKP